MVSFSEQKLGQRQVWSLSPLYKAFFKEGMKICLLLFFLAVK